MAPPTVPEDVNPFAAPEVAPFEDPDLWVELAAYVAHGRYQEALAQARSADPALPADRLEVLNCLLEALAGDADVARDRAATLFARDALADREVTLLQAALGTGPPPAPGRHVDPLDLGVELATVYRSAQEAAARGRLEEAAGALTRLFRSELDAPWDTRPTDLDHWTALLRDVQRRYRWDPRGEWPSFDLTVQSGEGLTMVRKRALAQRPDLNLSTGLIARVNGVDGGSIHPGDVLRIPTEPVTVFVDVSKHWLLYSIGPHVVEAWPVGTGAHGSETITGTFVVGDKQENPTWWPKGRPPVLPHDPENPLGTRWIGWREEGAERDTSYGFHGTREPETIGFDASEGCVRMRNGDVEVLFEILPVGSRFTVRD
jgi:lipoprotein-anchoring transpeptidase ErfK/SrfK